MPSNAALRWAGRWMFRPEIIIRAVCFALVLVACLRILPHFAETQMLVWALVHGHAPTLLFPGHAAWCFVFCALLLWSPLCNVLYKPHHRYFDNTYAMTKVPQGRWFGGDPNRLLRVMDETMVPKSRCTHEEL